MGVGDIRRQGERFSTYRPLCGIIPLLSRSMGNQEDSFILRVNFRRQFHLLGSTIFIGFRENIASF